MHFSVIALLALACPFASGDRDRQQNVLEVADRGHFRQSLQETNTDSAAKGFYANTEGETYDPHGNKNESGVPDNRGNSRDNPGGGHAPGDRDYDTNYPPNGMGSQPHQGGTAASTPAKEETPLVSAKVKEDIVAVQGKIDKANIDGWVPQNDKEAREQEMQRSAADDFQGKFKELHKKLKTDATNELDVYAKEHGEQNFAGSYKNFAGEVMSLKPERATDLVAVAGQVENSNFAANKASNDYTKHLEALSSNLASIHDLMGSEASYGYNQIKAEIDSGKAPFKSVTIVYPLRAVENGQTFNFNSTDFTPETKAYFDGPVTHDLKEQLSRYKDDYHFTFCLHASTNLGTQRYWGPLPGQGWSRHEYAHGLVDQRKEKLRLEVENLFKKPDLAPIAGSVHIQAQWTKNPDQHANTTKHFESAVPFGVIMVLGDPKHGAVTTQAEANAEAGAHAQDVDKRRGCEDSAKDMDELASTDSSTRPAHSHTPSLRRVLPGRRQLASCRHGARLTLSS